MMMRLGADIIVMGAMASAIATMRNPKPRKRYELMDAPHDMPRNPFESRQVRRARERAERKKQKQL